VNRRSSSSLQDAVYAFLGDDSGSELAEFAYVLAFFSLIALISLQHIAQTGNGTIVNTEGNFSNSIELAP